MMSVHIELVSDRRADSPILPEILPKCTKSFLTNFRTTMSRQTLYLVRHPSFDRSNRRLESVESRAGRPILQSRLQNRAWVNASRGAQSSATVRVGSLAYQGRRCDHGDDGERTFVATVGTD